ncbi:Inner membrane transporter rhtA [Actinobaculum suis]|uniref:Inner membrane transporter rhtA n=1 Tax=Actinobaculum suis TaxID=1657 RepID=A0A7Z9C7P6_9ACTO|nr:EamA family transporter [Actinobaculum suis]VDG75475.1 Inner membrane transporter rhtA [Actinobaculum suis]
MEARESATSQHQPAPGPEGAGAGSANTGNAAGAQPPHRSRLAKWAPAMFLGEGLVEYIGAGLAVLLFATASSLSVAWGRITISALVLLLWRRPFPKHRDGRLDWRLIGGAAVFGLALGAMNMTFYCAIEHIPLGTGVALEYLGPVAVAVLGGRGWKSWAGALFAIAGVFSISWAGVDLSDPQVRTGVGFALAAAVFWALYIVLGRRGAAQGNGIDRLAIGMAVAAIVYAPIGAPGAGPLLSDWKVFGTLVLVALMSSVVPFTVEQIILGALPASTFALLASLLPATSMVAGIITLRQIPNLGQFAGLVFVSIAVALASMPSEITRRGEHRRRRR